MAEIIFRRATVEPGRIRLFVEWGGGAYCLGFNTKADLMEWAKALAKVSLDDLLGAAVRKLLETDATLANLAGVTNKRVTVTESVSFERLHE